ncbi:MAG: hypothetical protein COV67_04470 [Nitrospinae bacterium CG11_big_fil_rev_8_21_14_0_20_56_8]|nr:MAG: hypothetical protein COV67_04470 [Nitrospinae bacterium CG11_big_fil_rev_8_21_14_0_20_56_8]
MALATPNAFAGEDYWNIEGMKDNAAVLQPGTTTYCDKNFKVENMGTEMAEVQIILGNGANYTVDRVEPKATKAYTLGPDTSMGGNWENMRSVRIDEARIVNSSGTPSNIKVLCK